MTACAERRTDAAATSILPSLQQSRAGSEVGVRISNKPSMRRVGTASRGCLQRHLSYGDAALAIECSTSRRPQQAVDGCNRARSTRTMARRNARAARTDGLAIGCLWSPKNPKSTENQLAPENQSPRRCAAHNDQGTTECKLSKEREDIRRSSPGAIEPFAKASATVSTGCAQLSEQANNYKCEVAEYKCEVGYNYGDGYTSTTKSLPSTSVLLNPPTKNTVREEEDSEDEGGANYLAFFSRQKMRAYYENSKVKHI